ncbi:MAG: hypothetical protein ACKV1O_30140 [Saprospiraceae bacterium]
MNSFFKQLSTIFYALAAGQLLFCAVAVFLRKQGTAAFDEASIENSTLTMVTPFLALAAFTAAWFVHKMRASQGMGRKNLSEKTMHYRTTVLLRSAMIEGANIILLVAYLLSGRPIHLAWFVAGMLLFFYFRPSPANFVRDYQLSFDEATQLTKDN